MVDLDASAFVGAHLRFSFCSGFFSRFSSTGTACHLKRCWFSVWEILSGAFIIAPVLPCTDSQGTCGNVTISGFTVPLLNLG